MTGGGRFGGQCVGDAKGRTVCKRADEGAAGKEDPDARQRWELVEMGNERWAD